MTLQDFAPFGKDARIEPEKAFRLGMGAVAAPLWAAYYAAAGAGVAYWAMTAWTRSALLGEAKSFALAEPLALETPEATVKAVAVAEAATQAVAEIATEVAQASQAAEEQVQASAEPAAEAVLETAVDTQATTEALDAAAVGLVQPAVEQASAEIAAVGKPARRKPIQKLDA